MNWLGLNKVVPISCWSAGDVASDCKLYLVRTFVAKSTY